MKTYKGLRGIPAALVLLLLASTPAHADPRLAVSPLGLQITQLQEVRGNTTHVDAISGTRTVAEWDLQAVAE